MAHLDSIDYDPFKILQSKSFPKGKKMRYYTNMVQQLEGTLGFDGSFRTMVKSG